MPELALKSEEISPTTRRVVCVLGMHRSGTSAIAKGLECWGIHMGDALISPGMDNPRGYWEDAHIVAINQKLMQRCDLAWNDVRILSAEVFLDGRHEDLTEQAFKLLEQRIAVWNNWGFKDPRTLRTLPFWLRVADLGGIDIQFVLALRHPISVVASLQTRNGMDAVRSQLMWLAHWVPFLNLLENQKIAILHYDQVLEHPAQTMQRAGEHLGFAIHAEQLHTYKHHFLNGKLRHHQAGNDSPENPLILPLVHKTMQVLENCGVSPDAQFWQAWKLLQNEHQNLSSILDLIDHESERRRRRRTFWWKMTHVHR
ncbi:hypothetical protein H7F10_10530 [Acidithiobacillus sp. HP-6]|uniref:sulfotransferase family protein n=1 Tax=unclassified Acidithiobacillus TaxID=2614800 RepID=UPI001879FD3A|nr:MULTISPECIES: hypothetical protein [unclassified Acidithiobacillus]MBE7563374.1 hypothetical protein [Acidithiobacillus sp. HP-6]MBE7570932.1 hypothetical protein [Acidithiobacillus sp. HP-2]